jgi:hypothetical protein
LIPGVGDVSGVIVAVRKGVRRCPWRVVSE